MTIKFSHFYNKLPRDYRLSVLLQVLPIRLEDLSPQFRHYDTTYSDGGEERQYPLPAEGDYMILILQAGSGHGHIWTTVRRWTPEMEHYYCDLIGQVVECEVIA